MNDLRQQILDVIRETLVEIDNRDEVMTLMEEQELTADRLVERIQPVGLVWHGRYFHQPDGQGSPHRGPCDEADCAPTFTWSSQETDGRMDAPRIETRQLYLFWPRQVAAWKVAESIVSDLALCRSPHALLVGLARCIFCMEQVPKVEWESMEDPARHAESCPWRRARDFVEASGG